jgi:hypothetical protein
LTDAWDGGKKVTMQMDRKSQQVTGIGEDAYTFMGGILFRKGSAQVNVIATAYHGTKPKDEAVRYVAQKVAAAL